MSNFVNSMSNFEDFAACVSGIINKTARNQARSIEASSRRRFRGGEEVDSGVPPREEGLSCSASCGLSSSQGRASDAARTKHVYAAIQATRASAAPESRKARAFCFLIINYYGLRANRALKRIHRGAGSSATHGSASGGLLSLLLSGGGRVRACANPLLLEKWCILVCGVQENATRPRGVV